LKLANTKAFKESGFKLDTKKLQGCEPETFGTYQYFNCVLDKYVGAAHHIVGTCKRGNSSDPQVVVDPKLRVYGIRNLRVVDDSIMPIIPSANTNAPTIMIGEKASELIKMAHKDYNKATIVSKCGASFSLLWVLLMGKMLFYISMGIVRNKLNIF
jgi:hypothetical protein